MFRVPRVNVIESDEGLSVEVHDRTGLLYTEGLRSIRIDSEVLNANTIAVFKDSIRAWNPPYDNETIDDNKRERIIDNIRRAFNFERKSIEVE
jgi:hypothetical protein